MPTGISLRVLAYFCLLSCLLFALESSTCEYFTILFTVVLRSFKFCEVSGLYKGEFDFLGFISALNVLILKFMLRAVILN